MDKQLKKAKIANDKKMDAIIKKDIQRDKEMKKCKKHKK